MPLKMLITGGVRSGKSRCAEDLMAGEEHVTYVAPGPAWPEDAEWRARVALHRIRRPAHWETVESSDLPSVLGGLTAPGLIDCLGTWLTGQLDELGAWGDPTGGSRLVPSWADELQHRIDALVAAWDASDQRLIAVTNEVGMGLVSERHSGRVFADWLGRVNQAIAGVSDEVILVVAGRRLTL